MANKITVTFFLVIFLTIPMHTRTAAENVDNDSSWSAETCQQLEKGKADATTFRDFYRPERCLVTYAAMRYRPGAFSKGRIGEPCGQVLRDMWYTLNREKALDGESKTWVQGLSLYKRAEFSPAVELSSSDDAIVSFDALPLSDAIKVIEHALGHEQ